LPGVLPATVDLQGENAPTSDQAWLTITGVVNGVVSYTCAENTSGSNRMATITLLGQPVVVAQEAPLAPYPPVLGTTRLVVGPAAGSDGVMLSMSSTTLPWSVSADVPWLHPVNASGTGTDRVRFSFDANPGGTRSGTLSLCGLTLAVTQAGATYQAASSPIGTLVSSGLNQPRGVAVDATGNVFIADTANNAIKRWNAADQTLTVLVDTGLSGPTGVALDSDGNLWFSDTNNNAIKRWNAADGSVTTVIGGLKGPLGLAIDRWNNLYIADRDPHSPDGRIKKWISTEGTLITLIASDSVFGGPIHMESLDSVAVDAAGNVYFNNSFFEPLENHSVTRIRRWNVASNTFDIVADDAPGALAVDPGGDVYYGNPIKRWNRTDHTVTTLGPPMGGGGHGGR
jgi:sugar lactone lactonase YvrE